MANELDQATLGQMSNPVPLQNQINDCYLMQDDPLSLFPVPIDNTMYQRVAVMLGNLPTVNWVGFSTDAATVRSVFETREEQCFGYRNQVLWDEANMADRSIIGGAAGQKAFQLKQYMEAVTFANWYNLINNGDLSGTSNLEFAPVGLRARLNQSIYKTNSEMKINAGPSAGVGLDLTDGATKTALITLLKKLKRLIRYTGSKDGKDVLLLCNDDMKDILTIVLPATLDSGAFYRTDQDNFKRDLEYIYGARIIDVGRVTPDNTGAQTARVITSYEQVDGTYGTDGTDAYTSIMAVRVGPRNFRGWRLLPQVTRKDDVNTSPGAAGYGWQGGMFFQDFFGWLNTTSRDIGWLYGLKVR